MPPTREPEPHQGPAGTERARRLVVAALLAVAALANLSWLAAPLVGATLHPAQTLVSELGARDQPGAWLLHMGDLLTGTLCAAGALLARPLLPAAPWLGIARHALLLFGLCTAADAALPVDCAVTVDETCRALEASGEVTWRHALHSVTGTIESVAAVLIAFGLGLATRHVPGWSGRSRTWLLAGLVLASSNLLLVVQYFTSLPGIGVTQRLGLAAWSLTLALAALGVLTMAEADAAPQAAALAVPAVPRSLTLPELPGTVVNVEVHNPAAPVVAMFSSGLSLPLEVWHPVLPGLPGLTAVLVDRPGLGGSPPWPPEPVGLAGQVRVIKGVLEQLRADGSVAAGAPVVLVGHSYGGLLVEAAARLHPGLAAALVLVDPADPAAEAASQGHHHMMRLARGCVRRPGCARRLGAAVAWAVRAGGTARTDAESLPARAREHFSTGRHLMGSLAELDRIGPEARELVQLSGRPPAGSVHLVVARWGGWPLYLENRRWVRRMAQRGDELGARTHLVAAGHLVTLDAPRSVATAIRTAAGQAGAQGRVGASRPPAAGRPSADSDAG